MRRADFLYTVILKETQGKPIYMTRNRFDGKKIFHFARLSFSFVLAASFARFRLCRQKTRFATAEARILK